MISGIADPKLQLPASISAAALQSLRASSPLLSPFDEAALELGLKLRDADPSTQLTALVAASSAQDKLLQHVASFRLDHVTAYASSQVADWQSCALANGLASLAAAQMSAPFDLILIGREFGDYDEGSVPVATACALGWPFISQAMHVQRTAPTQLQILRQFGVEQEILTQPTPVLAAVTNHARNKLRHPLLKNVMAAKKMQFQLSEWPDLTPPSSPQLRSIAVAKQPGNTVPCQMIAGDAATQAQALAKLLLTSIETL